MAATWGKPLTMNVSMPIAAVMLDLGLPASAVKTVPILARTASLLAHLAEEQEHPIGFVLAAGAERTSRIRLTSAVSVLSSDDPVRVFQDFATLDLLSGGRAEIMAGRGAFIESFPLFGYDLHDYDELFAEKLELLLKLRESSRVTWSGKHRASLDGISVYPRPVQHPLPVWVAV